jgi:sulfate/thiosulfate transport system substrate-binding protein
MSKLSNSAMNLVKAQSRFKRFWGKHLRVSVVSLFLASIVLSVTIASCAGSNLASTPEVKLRLISYSVTKAAIDQIIPKFVEKWQQEHRQKVIFEPSYGGSGSQAADVISGVQEADIVYLALPLDVKKIEQAGLINKGWENKSPRNGVVTRSVAAIVTREGNPKKINTWSDLAKDNIQIIAANPKTSGIAIWEFLAFWGSVTQTGGNDATALDFVTKVYRNIPTLTKDAREASEVFFQQQKGDALINYENEVIFAQQKNYKLPYTIPSVNISIDNPVALVDTNVDKHGTREVAQAFVNFLYSDDAQKEFAKLGFRPVSPFLAEDVAIQHTPIKTLFTSQDLGGWDLIQKEFLDSGAIFDQIWAKSKA